MIFYYPDINSYLIITFSIFKIGKSSSIPDVEYPEGMRMTASMSRGKYNIIADLKFILQQFRRCLVPANTFRSPGGGNNGKASENTM